MPSADSGNVELQKQNVLVTRPGHQAAAFISKLQNAGAQTYELPCIEIVYSRPDSILATDKDASLASDWWIFTSSNAVIGASHCLLLPDIKSGTQIAAIGNATNHTLNGYGITTNFTPDKNTSSEHFFTQYQQQVKAGDRVTIVRGDSGRETLKNKLEKNKIKVNYLEVYQRKLPAIPAAEAKARFQQALPCVISITSDLCLSNLLQLLPTDIHPQLFECPVAVNSKRCAIKATQAGFVGQIEVAQPPGDEGQIQALSRLR